MAQRRASLEESFWAKVRKTDECWIWTAGRQSNGYGTFRVRDRRSVVAHRYAYELLIGPIPDGLQLDHLCRVRHCVNPAHLEPVTQQENILRGYGLAAVQARQTHCKAGHPFDGANTRVYKGHRICRTCRRGHQTFVSGFCAPATGVTFERTTVPRIAMNAA